MAYNANIPRPGDQLSASQPQILANFQALASVIGGIFALQPAPGTGTSATELAIYNKNDVTGIPQLFLRRQGVAPGGAEASITAFANVIAAPNNNGYTMLSSGLCLKFGRLSMAGGVTNVNVAYEPTYPFLELYTRLVTFNRTGLMAGPAVYNQNQRTCAWCEDPGIGTPLTHIQLGKPNGWVGFVNYIAIGRII